MVNNSGDMLEQPFVWAVVEIKYVRVLRLVHAELAPASGNEGSLTRDVDSLHQLRRHSIRIVDNNAAEADVHWCGTCPQESIQLWVRGIFGGVSEEEAANVYPGSVCAVP